MSRRISLFYIGTIILVQPYWAAEIYANFAFFNNINPVVYEKIRPWEALFRYSTLPLMRYHFDSSPCVTDVHCLPATPGGFTQHAICFG